MQGGEAYNNNIGDVPDDDGDEDEDVQSIDRSMASVNQGGEAC